MPQQLGTELFSQRLWALGTDCEPSGIGSLRFVTLLSIGRVSVSVSYSAAGLLIWEDAMFACAMYPAERPEFLETADVEFRQFVRRVQHHPSIAVWAGNNENEVALATNW